MGASRFLNSAELHRVISIIPANVRRGIAELAVELGLATTPNDPAASFMSFMRGDEPRRIGTTSIFPIHDSQRLARFRQFRDAVEQLVGCGRRNQKLAFALVGPLRQIQDRLNSISGFMGEQNSEVMNQFHQNVDAIRRSVEGFVGRMLPIERQGVENLARKNGKSSGQWPSSKSPGSPLPGVIVDKDWYEARRVSVNEVVDIVVAALSPARAADVRDQAERLLFAMAISYPWYVTSGIHRSEDRTNHITVMVEPVDGQMHLKLNKRDELFLITFGKQGLPF